MGGKKESFLVLGGSFLIYNKYHQCTVQDKIVQGVKEER